MVKAHKASPWGCQRGISMELAQAWQMWVPLQKKECLTWKWLGWPRLDECEHLYQRESSTQERLGWPKLDECEFLYGRKSPTWKATKGALGWIQTSTTIHRLRLCYTRGYQLELRTREEIAWTKQLLPWKTPTRIAYQRENAQLQGGKRCFVVSSEFIMYS